MEESIYTRRRFILSGAAASAGLIIAGCGKTDEEDEEDSGDEGIPPTEDLMREHGAISRILLIYDECRRRLDAKTNFPVKTLHDAVTLFKKFAEDYHEKMEEDYVFPAMEKAGKHADITKILRDQHNAGRRISSEIEQMSAAGEIKSDAERTRLSELLLAFNMMYRPHKAWEDTVIFPGLLTASGDDEFDKMGDTFENREKEMFGENGFEKIVGQIKDIESTLGLNDLSKFTPKV